MFVIILFTRRNREGDWRQRGEIYGGMDAVRDRVSLAGSVALMAAFSSALTLVVCSRGRDREM